MYFDVITILYVHVNKEKKDVYTALFYFIAFNYSMIATLLLLNLKICYIQSVLFVEK